MKGLTPSLPVKLSQSTPASGSSPKPKKGSQSHSWVMKSGPPAPCGLTRQTKRIAIREFPHLLHERLFRTKAMKASSRAALFTPAHDSSRAGSEEIAGGVPRRLTRAGLVK